MLITHWTRFLLISSIHILLSPDKELETGKTDPYPSRWLHIRKYGSACGGLTAAAHILPNQQFLIKAHRPWVTAKASIMNSLINHCKLDSKRHIKRSYIDILRVSFLKSFYSCGNSLNELPTRRSCLPSSAAPTNACIYILTSNCMDSLSTETQLYPCPEVCLAAPAQVGFRS